MASTPFTLSNHIIGRRFSAVAPPHSTNLRRSTCTSASYATAERPSAAATENASPPASLYEVLGVRTSATGQEIKFAYRKLARVLHPDAAAAADSAADDFMRVHAAYATLSDPEKRAAYDSSLLRRRTRTAVLSAVGYSARRRTWETDQCW